MDPGVRRAPVSSSTSRTAWQRAGAPRGRACPWGRTSRRTSGRCTTRTSDPPSERRQTTAPAASIGGSSSGTLDRGLTAPPLVRDQRLLEVAQRLAVGVEVVPGPVPVRPPATTTPSGRRSRGRAGPRARRRALRIGIRTSASTRRSRLRCIRSARPIQTSGSPPFSNQKIRVCSRKRPRMLRTRMFSRQAGHAGPQRADAAHPAVDRDAGLRGRGTARRSSPRRRSS